MRPTVVVNLSDTLRLMTEEIFGPVVCVVPFDTEEEVSIYMFRSGKFLQGWGGGGVLLIFLFSY